jgi:hypothetical protein
MATCLAGVLGAERAVLDLRSNFSGPGVLDEVFSELQRGGSDVLGRGYIPRFLNDSHRDNSHGNSWAQV